MTIYVGEGSESLVAASDPDTLFVSDYGAAADLFLGTSATTVANSTAVTLADASLTSADVGKTICINGACSATTGGSWTTTISSVTNPTHCVVAPAPTSSVSGAYYAYGSDDTAAINAAIAAGIALGVPQFTVQFQDGKGYMIAGAYTTSVSGVPYYSQIPLPYVSPGPTPPNYGNPPSNRVRIELCGQARRTKDIYSVPVKNGDGPILFTAQANQTNDINARVGAHGLPSVIGGPCTLQGDVFNAACPYVHDLIFLGPHRTEPTFLDFYWCAQAVVNDNLFQTNETFALMSPSYQSNAGAVMPSNDNIGVSILNRNNFNGMTVGFAPGELLDGTGNFTFQNVVGIGFIGDNSTNLANHLAQHNSSYCQYHVAGWNPASSTPQIAGQAGALVIDAWVMEDAPGGNQWDVVHHVWMKDGASNGSRIEAKLHRRISGAGLQADGILVAGSTADPVVATNPYGVRIISEAESRGPVGSLPSVPGSGTAFGLYYRDAIYTLTGGTVSSALVGNVTVPYISGSPIFVPSGMNLTLTYSVLPTLQSIVLL